MIKRFHKRQDNTQRSFRINERIFATTLRVLDGEGKQIGVLTKFEALQKAREEGLDLVEIAPAATPPVAKIIDFKKFLYQLEKKKREEKRKAKTTETKEVRLGPFMNDHDLDVMVQRAHGFIMDGDKVRFVVKFKGRQVTHPEFGFQIVRKVAAKLSDISKIEKEPRLEGKQLTAILAPGRSTPVEPPQGGERKSIYAKEENKEISKQTV